MKTDKKIIFTLGIGLMLLSVTLIGCINQSSSVQTVELKQPTFILKKFVLDYYWYYPEVPIKHPDLNDSMISFDLIIENPNNESIEIEILLCHIIGYSGETLFSFKPMVCKYMNYWNPLTIEKITIGPNQNITLTHYMIINRNTTLQNIMDLLDDTWIKVSLSSLYKINGQLHWFDTNLSEVLMDLTEG